MFIKNWSTYVFTIGEPRRRYELVPAGLAAAGLSIVLVPWLVRRLARR
jgi:hypothetical protein